MPLRDPRKVRRDFIAAHQQPEQFIHAPSSIRPLARPRTAREFALCILDEHKQTGAFVSDLIEDHVDRSQSGFLKKPPLSNFLGMPKKSKAAPFSEPSKLSRLDRRLVMELVSGVVRRQATLDAILRTYVSKPRSSIEPRLWLLMQLGVYQLVLMSGVPVHAAVNETVELGRFAQEPAWCGIINGVMRSLARDVEANMVLDSTLSPDAVPIQVHRSHGDVGGREVIYRHLGRPLFQDPATERRLYLSEAFTLPMWLLDRWAQRFGEEELQRLAEWFAVRHAHTLRVNPLRTTRENLLQRFSAQLFETVPACFGAGQRPNSIWYDGPMRIIDLPGFLDGHFTIQDETAIAAGELLAPQPGEVVLDLCAAPGTKTTHLAELMKNEGQIIAADVDLNRLQRVEENAERLGLTIIKPMTIPAEATEIFIGSFDAILIDAPCSNTGVLGKRPEVRSRLTPQDVRELSAIQLRLTKMAAKLLKPGGRMVYSTCSIEPEENCEVITQLLESDLGLELVSTQEFVPGRPSDGGYQALLRKVAQ